MIDRKPKSIVSADRIAETNILGGPSADEIVRGFCDSDGCDLLRSYQEFYDADTAEEFYELNYMAPIHTVTANRILAQVDYEPSDAEARQYYQHVRHSVLLVRYEGVLIAKLKSNELTAKGIEDGAPLHEPRQLINAAVWDILKLDIAKSSASGPGRTIRSIRISQSRPKRTSHERTDTRPYVGQAALKGWMVDWFKGRKKHGENRGCDLCEIEARAAFPNHQVPRDLVRDIWPEVRGPKLKTGPKKGSKRPPRLVSGDTNDGSDGKM